MNPPLLNLPDELLLMVLDELPALPIARQVDLANICLVHRKLLPLAREKLLIRPLVHISKIDSLVKPYLRYPKLAALVQVLDIIDLQSWTENSKVKEAMFLAQGLWPRQENNNTFFELCDRVITSTAVQNQRLWKLDLRKNSVTANFCVLISMLPCLNTLLFGTPHGVHIPGLASLLQGWVETHRHTRFAYNAIRETDYLREILNQLAPRLRDIEFPAHWNFWNQTRPHAFAFSRRNTLGGFTGLTRATVFIHPLHRWTAPRFLFATFPPSLRSSTIMLDERSERDINGVIEEIINYRDDFPNLRHVLFYDRNPGSCQAKWHPRGSHSLAISHRKDAEFGASGSYIPD